VAYGQNAEMADAFRAEGKIYVVVAIILIVLTGLIVYLFLLDRKLNKLEGMIKGRKQTKSQGKAF
jgi:CcmD family protein